MNTMRKQNKNNTKNKRSRNRQRGRRSPVKVANKQWVMECYGPRTVRNGFQMCWQRTTLKYVQTVAFSVATGTYAENQFRANSVYDPDLTGTGGQPLGFDNLAALFARYRVNAFNFEVQMMSLSASYKGVCVVINGAETPTTYDEICEFPRAQQRGIGFNGSPTAIFTGKVLLSRLNGKSQDAYHIDDLTGSVNTSSPVEAINFHVGIQNDNVATISLNITCTMWYDVVFYDPIIPVRSFVRKLPNQVVTGPNEVYQPPTIPPQYQEYLKAKALANNCVNE